MRAISECDERYLFDRSFFWGSARRLLGFVYVFDVRLDNRDFVVYGIRPLFLLVCARKGKDY